MPVPVTTDYLSFVLSFPMHSPFSVLSLFFLALMRVIPFVALAPFLGARIPGGVKMGFAVALVAILLPHMLTVTLHPIPFDLKFMGLMFKELFIGLILALMISFPFYMAESAGVLIDYLRGSSALMVTDPSTQVQSSPIGQLYNYVLIVFFFQINGFYYFLDAVFQSYTLIPPDVLINPIYFSPNIPFWQTVMELLTVFTSISIQLSAPSLVAILMAEMFLGIANRLAPQVQIAFLGMSIKSLLGIAMLFAGWFFILQQMSKMSLSWIENITNIVQGIPVLK